MIYSLPYFQRPYKDSDYLSVIKKEINGKYYTVYRPNHGLAHSLRQGFLVRDIVTLLKCEDDWLKKEISSDPYFTIKLAILSSFQRSGRQSEVSSSDNPKLYEKYENNDVDNMIHALCYDKSNNKYFTNDDEIRLWASALKWNNFNKNIRIQKISKLIKAAHLLDLRRIPSFDMIRIKYEVAELLEITPNSTIMNILWDQSGKYLNVSGDRDMVVNKTFWSDRFFILHQHPKKLYFALRSVMF
jgi:hypothetical protein